TRPRGTSKTSPSTSALMRKKFGDLGIVTSRKRTAKSSTRLSWLPSGAGRQRRLLRDFSVTRDEALIERVLQRVQEYAAARNPRPYRQCYLHQSPSLSRRLFESDVGGLTLLSPLPDNPAADRGSSRCSRVVSESVAGQGTPLFDVRRAGHRPL